MTTMRVLLSLAAVLATSHAEPSDRYCCAGGALRAGTASCVADDNTTTPADLACKESVQLELNYTYSDSGAVVLLSPPGMRLDPSTFCVVERHNATAERTVLFCVDGEEVAILDERVLGYCMFVSAIFLTLTALVYSVVPEVRDVQGKSIINFCISLAVAMFILFIMRTIPYSNMGLCAVRGFLVYFFILASFFWTNCISIQTLLNLRRPTVSDYGNSHFKWYALYAWGCPSILTTCMAIVNYYPGNHLRPGIGLNHCWFYDKTQQWYYMYSVTTALLALNGCIFVYICARLCRHPLSASNAKSLKYKTFMTLRLCIVMGLPWVFEMISSLNKPHIIWVILDILNTLQGPMIFLLLVILRRRVVKALYKQGYLDCISGLVERHLAVVDDEEDIVQHTTDVAYIKA